MLQNNSETSFVDVHMLIHYKLIWYRQTQNIILGNIDK